MIEHKCLSHELINNRNECIPNFSMHNPDLFPKEFASLRSKVKVKQSRYGPGVALRVPGS